ncbi:hypothetical protein FGF76_24015, partial [Salmonella sp. gx-f4]|nr:hypothetical protein [Salmonella sp. gx-f4]
RIALPLELQKIQDVFHVSMLWRYKLDHSLVISTEDIEEKELRDKRVPLVKILWRNHNVEKSTWEPEETMRSQYPPYLFK